MATNKLNKEIKIDNGTLVICFKGEYRIGENNIKGMTIQDLIDEAKNYEPPKVNIFDYSTDIYFEE